MKERDKELLGAEIFGHCMKKPMSVSNLTKKIYGYDKIESRRLPSVGRVFQVVETLVELKLLEPNCNNGQLCFQVRVSFFDKKKTVKEKKRKTKAKKIEVKKVVIGDTKDILEVEKLQEGAKKTISGSNITIVNQSKKSKELLDDIGIFRDWIKNMCVKTFSVKDFTRIHPTISEEQTMKVIQHELQEGRLNQLDMKGHYQVRGGY